MYVRDDVVYVKYCTKKDLEILDDFAKNPTIRRKDNFVKKITKLKDSADENNFSIYAKATELIKAIECIYNGDAHVAEKQDTFKSSKNCYLPDYAEYGTSKFIADDYGGIHIIEISDDIDDEDWFVLSENILGVNKGESSLNEIIDSLTMYLDDKLDDNSLSYKAMCDFVRLFRLLTQVIECDELYISNSTRSIKFFYWNK